MYNVTVGSVHPSVICVELSKLVPSLDALMDLLSSDYVEEGMPEFIEEFARTDVVMPTDKTLGFVVVNSNKKAISLSFSNLDTDTRDGLTTVATRFRELGYETELDLPSN